MCSQGSTYNFKVRQSVFGHGQSGMNPQERPSTVVHYLGLYYHRINCYGQHSGYGTKAAACRVES